LFPSQREIFESRWSFTLLLYSQTPNSKTDSFNKSSGDEIIWRRAATWTTIIGHVVSFVSFTKLQVARCAYHLQLVMYQSLMWLIVHGQTRIWGTKLPLLDSIRDPSLQLAHKVFHRLRECNHKHDRNSQLRASSKTWQLLVHIVMHVPAYKRC
jgi:hypothetical protein